MTKLTTDFLCEILLNSEKISPEQVREIVTREKADAELIGKAAIADGMVVLREAAVRKTLIGETTFDEVIRVTGEKVL